MYHIQGIFWEKIRKFEDLQVPNEKIFYPNTEHGTIISATKIDSSCTDTRLFVYTNFFSKIPPPFELVSSATSAVPGVNQGSIVAFTVGIDPFSTPLKGDVSCRGYLAKNYGVARVLTLGTVIGENLNMWKSSDHWVLTIFFYIRFLADFGLDFPILFWRI